MGTLCLWTFWRYLSVGVYGLVIFNDLTCSSDEKHTQKSLVNKLINATAATENRALNHIELRIRSIIGH